MRPAPRHSPRTTLAAASIASTLACAAAEAETLPVHYMPQVALNAVGVPDVLMAERTARWAAQAGLTLRWEPVPFKRSLEELRRNADAFCVLGVFDLPERRSYARFSLPLIPAEAQTLLVASRVAARMRALPDARSAMLDPRFELLAFDGVTYGATLDGWIAERQRRPLWANPGTTKVAPMLARGRADFTISSPSELRALRAAGGADAAAIEAVQLPGMPPPPTRHLACSLGVAPDWLARFDAAARGQLAPAPQ